MKTIRMILMATAIGLSAFIFATAPVGAEEKDKVEKCDRQGHVCTSGTECNVANCKKKKKIEKEYPRRRDPTRQDINPAK